MKELQKKVGEFVQKHGLAAAPESRLLDICSEMGELAKEVLKNTNYGKSKFNKSTFPTEELGDVLFSIICFANAVGADLEKDLDKVMEKYANRIKKRNSASSS